MDLLIDYLRPFLTKTQSSFPLLNSMPSTSMKLLDLNINLQIKEHQVSFPKLRTNPSMGQKSSRFKGVPLDISTKIVRSNKASSFAKR